MGSRDIDETKAATALFGGHFFDMGRARVGLMQLASIFAGCEGVIREVAREGRNISGWDEGDHPLEMLFDNRCTAEVSRLLIEAAVTVRMLDDMAGHHVVGVNFTVGDLDEGSGRRPLSLREACNKIVHATNVEFDLGGGTTTFTDKAGEEVTECIVYLRPTSVELRGNWEDRAWSAELQVYAFIKAATMVTFRYEAALDEPSRASDIRDESCTRYL
jgi:hypothetical protein